MDSWKPMEEHYREEQAANDTNKLYIGLHNTPQEYKSKEFIREIFSDHGKINSVHFPNNDEDRGFCFIIFKNKSDALEAMEELKMKEPYKFMVSLARSKPPDRENANSNRGNYKKNDNLFSGSDDETDKRNNFNNSRKSSDSPMKYKQRESFSSTGKRQDDNEKLSNSRLINLECIVCQRRPSSSCGLCGSSFCSDECFTKSRHQIQNCQDVVDNYVMKLKEYKMIKRDNWEDVDDVKPNHRNRNKFDDEPLMSDNRNNRRSFENVPPRSENRKSFENEPPRSDYRNNRKSFENGPPRSDDWSNKNKFDNGPLKSDNRNNRKLFENEPSDEWSNKRSSEDRPTRFDNRNNRSSFESAPKFDNRHKKEFPQERPPRSDNRNTRKSLDGEPSPSNYPTRDNRDNKFGDRSPNYGNKMFSDDGPSRSDDAKPSPSKSFGHGSSGFDKNEDKRPESKAKKNNFFREKLMGVPKKNEAGCDDDDALDSSQKTNCSLSMCQVGEEIKPIKIVKSTSDGLIVLGIPKNKMGWYNDVCTVFCTLCDDNNTPYSPKRGEVAAIKHETGWYRAVKGPGSNWLLLDEGSTLPDEDIHAVTKCPMKFKSEPPIAVLLTNMRKTVEEIGALRIDRKLKNDLMVDILGNGDKVLDSCSAKPWPWHIFDQLFDDNTKSDGKPKMMDTKNSLHKNFTNGCMVYMAGYKLPNVVYLRLADSRTDTIYNSILNMAAAEGIKAEKAGKNVDSVSPRAICLVKDSDDGAFYRCVVVDKDANRANVVYMDLVKQARVAIADLYQPSNILSDIPSSLTKMTLANVVVHEHNIYPSKLEKYLDSLKMQPLKMTYNCNASELSGTGVVNLVVDSTNQNVNTTITGIITPVWKKMEESNVDIEDIGHALEDDLQNVKLENYVKLIIMENKFIDDGTLVVMPHNKQVTMDLKWLNQEIQEYCSKNQKPYLPRTDEVCAVITEDEKWQRAICTEQADTEVGAMMVDQFGYVKLHYKNIRKLPMSLAIQQPRLMLPVQLQGLPERISAKTVEKLKTLFKVGHVLSEFEIKYDEAEAMNYLYIKTLIAWLREQANN